VKILLSLLLMLLPASLLICPSAKALSTSERALRIEDRREGNVVLGAEQAIIEKGEIYHTILLLWGRLDIHGQVDEVVVLSGRVVFHEGAKLNKSLVVMGGAFESLPGAQVTPDSVVVKSPGPLWRLALSAGNVWRDNFDWVARLLSSLAAIFLLWITGWGLFTAFPNLQKNTADRLWSEGAQNFVVALLGTVFTPILGIMLIISLIGIALLPFYLLLLVVAAALSYLAAALWAGHRLLPPKEGERLRPLGLFLGLLTLQLLWVIPVWWSWLPVILLWTLGWGALLRGLRRVWR
jgi:hypothetical protein